MIRQRDDVPRPWIAAALAACTFAFIAVAMHAILSPPQAAIGSRILLGVGSSVLALGAYAAAKARRPTDGAGPELSFLGLGAAGLLRTYVGGETVDPAYCNIDRVLATDTLIALAFAGSLLASVGGRTWLIRACVAFTAFTPLLTSWAEALDGGRVGLAAALGILVGGGLSIVRGPRLRGVAVATRAAAFGVAASLAVTALPLEATTRLVLLRAGIATPLLGVLAVVLLRGGRARTISLDLQVRLGTVGATLTWSALTTAFGVGGAGQPSDPIISPFLALLFAAGYGLTWCGLLLARSVTRQINQEASVLRKAATDLAQSRFEGRIRLTSKHLLGHVAEAFNAMAERIHLQREELLILARVMEGTSDPVAVLNTDGRVAFANRAFATCTGFDPKALIGRSLVVMLTPRSEGETLEGLEDALTSGTTWAGETALITRDQRRLASFTTAAPVEFDGEHRYHVAVCRDLRTLEKLESERSAFTENLVRIQGIGSTLVSTLESERIHENLLCGLKTEFAAHARLWLVAEPEHCGDGSMAEACGIGDRRLRWIDIPCGADFVPTRTTLAFGEALPGRVAASKERIISRGDHADEMLVHETWQGETSVNTRMGFPIIVEGELIGVLEVAVGDATGRLLESLELLIPTFGAALSNSRLHRKVLQQARALEELTTALEGTATTQRAHADELRALNEKLLEADRLKSRFLSTTSHELRTPLGGCMGFLSLIIDGMAADRNEELEFVREAHACASKLLETINTVLMIAKIDAGSVPFEPVRLDVQALLDDAVGRCETGDLEVLVDVEPNTWVHADFRQTHKVLAELISNAVKFTDKGHVRITARPCSDKGIVEITVSDTGVGLAGVADVAGLFDAFVQAEGDDDRRFAGSGLGLTVCRELTRLMGGTVQLAGNSEGGATATLCMPIHRVEGFSAEEKTVVPGTGPVILVVDSDSEFVEHVRKATTEQGSCRVESAATAAEGFRMAQELLPDLIITEFALRYDEQPTLVTGQDLLAALAQEPKTADIRAVIMTGHPISQTEAGAPLHFKPMTHDLLTELLGHEQETPSVEEALRVLLVDDDPTVAEVVQEALAGESFDVHAVRNGREALYRLSRPASVYDVVLLDLLMPGLSGYEVLQSLRHELSSELPVVILSNDFETAEERSLLDECQVRGTISKDKIASAPHKLARAVVEAMRTT